MSTLLETIYVCACMHVRARACMYIILYVNEYTLCSDCCVAKYFPEKLSCMDGYSPMQIYKNIE